VRADRPEQAGGLVEGQELDGLARRARHGRSLCRRGTARNNRSGRFSRARAAGQPQVARWPLVTRMLGLALLVMTANSCVC
jgi:hypothetical protein